jgi:hypothetical protein
VEQQDDRSACRSRFAIENLNSIRFDAMVRRQRDVWNVCHGSSEDAGVLIEVNTGSLVAYSVDADGD